MDFLTKPITSERLEEIGQSFYKLGKGFFFYGLIGLAMFLLSIIGALVINGGEGVSYLLEFDLSGYEFMYIILPLSYMGIVFGVAGVPMYFSGLIIFALGRIAHNTETEKNFTKNTKKVIDRLNEENDIQPPKESKGIITRMMNWMIKKLYLR